MALKKQDLIDLIEEDGITKVDKTLTYPKIVAKYHETVVEIVIELWQSAD